MQNSVLAILLVGCALCTKDTSSPNQKDATLFRSFVQEVLLALEAFRDVMQTGTEDIPVLDPLQMDHLVFDLKNIDGEGDLTISGLVLKNLSNFIVNDAKVSTWSRRLSFDLSVPELVIIADTFDISEGEHHDQVIQGHGAGSLLVYDARARGTLRFKIPWSGEIQIYDVQLTALLGGFKSQLHGSVTVDSQLIDINQVLEYLVPNYMKDKEKEISGFLNPIVERSVNQALRGFNNTLTVRHLERILKLIGE